MLHVNLRACKGLAEQDYVDYKIDDGEKEKKIDEVFDSPFT